MYPYQQGWVPIETNLLRVMGNLAFGYVAFTPKGGCPLKPDWLEELMRWYWFKVVAFTPKGGCPLKHFPFAPVWDATQDVAFTPKGGCPLKLHGAQGRQRVRPLVAFTPKGGCPLKPATSRSVSFGS